MQQGSEREKDPSNLQLTVIHGLSAIEGKTIEKVATRYAYIFSLPPWSEVHNPQDIKHRLEAEMSKKDSVLIMLLDKNSSPQAFIWGFGGDLERETLPYMASSCFADQGVDKTAEIVRGSLEGLQEAGLGNLGTIYTSEVAVDPDWQDWGLASKLMAEMASQQLKSGNKVWIAWTSRQAKNYEIMTKHFGAAEVFSFATVFPGDNRVLLGGKLQTILTVLSRK